MSSWSSVLEYHVTFDEPLNDQSELGVRVESNSNPTAEPAVARGLTCGISHLAGVDYNATSYERGPAGLIEQLHAPS